MLEELSLKNFKSVRDMDVPMSPLTVLAGLNGSGKSTVLQAIALLKQSLETYPDASQMALRGELVRLGRSEDVQFEGAKTDEIVLGIKTSSCQTKWTCTATSKAVTLPVKC